MKKWLSLACFLLFMAGLSLPSWAQDKLPTVEELFKRMGEVNPGLKDYSSDIKVKLKFSVSSINMQGKYYYKKPDKYKLEIKKAPYVLKKYPQMFGWCLPDPTRHNCIVKLDKDAEGKECYVVDLIPIQGRGDLTKQEIWINTQNYTFPKQVYEYHYGTITVEAKYRKEGKFILFDTIEAYFDIKVPLFGNLKATALADYQNYKTNIGLPDSFFKTSKEKS